MTIYVHGFGHFHPENEITNRFLEELDIGTTDEWILERVGIRTRRTILPLDYIRETKNRNLAEGLEAALYKNDETSKRAAEMAIERAGISISDIGMVLCGSSVVERVTPAEACKVAALMGIETIAFDINSACTSFHAALYALSLMVPEKLPPFILYVSPENMTPNVDYSDRASAVLWGDAAIAAVVSTQVPSKISIIGNTFFSSPAGHDKVVVPRTSHFYQEGRTVQKFAISKTVQLVKDLQKKYGDPNRAFNFVGHQANLIMLENICQRCDISNERHYSNIEWFGNTAAAGSASVISQNWDNWTETDDIGVAGVGAGLSWSSYLLRFEGRTREL
ncbi:MAG: ketoacyl-ACP synthase III [Deltaproteobacteria bacterium]|nr:ketoacyl-ACP synthase III [Deltaproteobacteria bacterium]